MRHSVADISSPQIYAVVPCAGTGSRAGATGPKQYQKVAGMELLRHTLKALLDVSRVKQLRLVLSPGDTTGGIVSLGGHERRQAIRVDAVGGYSRAESVFNGLQALLADGAKADDWVMVHDAARCLVTPAQIDALIDACLPDPVGGLLALPLPDTLKSAVDGRVAQTLPRADKWLAQTPQMFRLGALHDALAAVKADDFAGITDEASAIEAQGGRPLLVSGSAQNFKVTYPEDFALADAILRSRHP